MTSLDNPTNRALAALREARPAQFKVLVQFLANPGATHQAIADALGCSKANVTKQLGRALKNFQELKSRAAGSLAGERNKS